MRFRKSLLRKKSNLIIADSTMLEIEADEVAKATNFCFYDQKINVSCNVRTIKLFK